MYQKSRGHLKWYLQTFAVLSDTSIHHLHLNGMYDVCVKTRYQYFDVFEKLAHLKINFSDLVGSLSSKHTFLMI